MGLCESCLEKDDAPEKPQELLSQMEDTVVEPTGPSSAEYYKNIIKDAQYTFLNANASRLPAGTTGEILHLRKKVATASVSTDVFETNMTAVFSNSGYPVERVAEVLCEPINIADHDILADEIVELVSQTMQLSNSSEPDSDIYAHLRSVTVN